MPYPRLKPGVTDPERAAAPHLPDDQLNFSAKFPPMARQDFAPQVTWAEIERQLTYLSGSPDRPCWEVDLLRKETAGQPPEFFLQRLLSLAWAIIDDAPDTLKAMRGGGMI